MSKFTYHICIHFVEKKIQTYFKWEGTISCLSSRPLMLIDKFTYLGSNILSTESDINICMDWYHISVLKPYLLYSLCSISEFVKAGRNVQQKPCVGCLLHSTTLLVSLFCTLFAGTFLLALQLLKEKSVRYILRFTEYLPPTSVLGRWHWPALGVGLSITRNTLRCWTLSTLFSFRLLDFLIPYLFALRCYLLTKLHSIFFFYYGGAHGIMVIVVVNGCWWSKFMPGYLHFT